MYAKKVKTTLSVAVLALVAMSAFAEYEADCKAAAKRKRNVMYYELGYNPCLWPKNKPFSPAAFRSRRPARRPEPYCLRFIGISCRCGGWRP